MISRKTAFIDLTKKENLDKINIDPRLIPSFVSVMKKMQNYFSKKGLIYANNYALLFEKFLLTDDLNSKFSIRFSRFNSTDYGCYSFHQRKIFVNEYLDPAKFEFVLCHEFIHFLMLTDSPFVENEKGEFEQKTFRFFKVNQQYGTFMSEAVTEFINKKIYPNSNLYTYQVKMLDYMHKIIGTEDKMFEYLRSYIPYDQIETFSDVNRYLNLFQNEYNGDITYEKISRNDNFINAQNKLALIFNDIINQEINSGKFRSVLDYVKRIYQLQDAEPIKSFELKNVITNANLAYLKNCLKLEMSKKQYSELYLGKLEDIISNYNKLQNNVITEYEIPLYFEKIKMQIKNDSVSLVFDNQIKTFEKNSINPNKLLNFKSSDRNGNDIDVSLLVNIFENNIEVKLSEPLCQEYNFSCDKKKLMHIEHNRIKNLKNDIKFLESQGNFIAEEKQTLQKLECNSQTL